MENIPRGLLIFHCLSLMLRKFWLKIILAAHFDAVRAELLAVFAVAVAEVYGQTQREDVVGQAGVADFDSI
jgi:hypothetical protein